MCPNERRHRRPNTQRIAVKLDPSTVIVVAMRPGLVEIVESCYRLDGDLESWMKSVGAVVDSHLGYGLGTIAIRYRLGNDLSFQPMAMYPVNISDATQAAIHRGTAGLPPSYAKATFASYPAAIASKAGSEEVRALTDARLREYFEPQGWHDIIVINGLDPTHHGFYLGAGLPKRGKMTSGALVRWSRIAAHMAAAHRLRTQLSANELRSAETAEAVLAPNGRVEHATDEAKEDAARETLAEGVRMLDRARSTRRRGDPRSRALRVARAARRAVDTHRYFESDGKRYVLARRNAPVPRGLDALTARECQALGFAQLGHSNKLIAYEMGVAASTVAVLLFRAAKKLGCTREALVETYTRMLLGT